MERFYPIGTPGRPWGPDERAAWLAAQRVQRSHRDDVIARLPALEPDYEVIPHGTLAYGEARYPQVALRSRGWAPGRPTVLITGGVHGYETSGVHGALAFAEVGVARYPGVNLMIVPCVSPWGYETINRWNPDAIDPNRSFHADSPSREASALMALVATIDEPLLVHIDLHETTDTDDSEFRPAKAARDGVPLGPGGIPDGFYTVGHTERPELAFQEAVIASVARVTHIAPPDERGQIIGEPVVGEGIILYDATRLGLCMGLSGARFTTTTEVYPDSPLASPELCVRAQVAAVVGGLDFALG